MLLNQRSDSLQLEFDGGNYGGSAGVGGGTAPSTGVGGGNDVELLCKTLQVEHKLFYFDLKENHNCRYLKISEKTLATRSTIIVPFPGISWFLDLFNYYVNSDDQDVFNKELQLDSPLFALIICFFLFLFFDPFVCFASSLVFYFDVGENRRCRLLKILEAFVSRNRSTIIVLAGSTRMKGGQHLETFGGDK